MEQGITVFVLPTQDDIVSFLAGRRPGAILVRSFEKEAELIAYKEGIDCIEDEADEIDGLNVVGCKVSFTRETEFSASADISELTFATVGEAKACRDGISDAEGLIDPLLFGPEDEGYEQLAAYVAQQPLTKGQWHWRLVCFTEKYEGMVEAIDPRDAVSRALTSALPDGRLIGEAFKVPLSFLDDAPGNAQTFYERVEGGLRLTVSTHPITE